MKKVLVANRGEIAIRIMRTLKRMGIKTVAVYSEADKQALHVQYADEAVLLGPAPSAASYLNADKIIAAAKSLQVDGIHPGYGFLSENADFAEKTAEAGITFIGPSPASIRVMGSKLAAKEAVKAYDIPMVPGTDTAITDLHAAQSRAMEIGFPILIKASAGGGGKGMRVVEKDEDFIEQMERAVSEATAAFGDGSVFIEKYVGSPRHIEIQVLSDRYGHTVHLFERECSIQRRHQKVIEEAPSSVLDSSLRARMGEAAVKVAKSCQYEGVGTVEFLLDENKNFYFLEMNTRLQVEHPVTEMITGIDLVEQQVRVARGEKLRFTQEELTIDGHAIEVRVYAEDPFHDFLPSIGTLSKYRRPEGNSVRLDDAYREGMSIPIYYDPMIAKLVTWGRDRAEAIERMKASISAYAISGIATTLPFGKFVMEHPAFVQGDFDTHFVKKHFNAPQEYRRELAYQAAVVTVAGWLKDKLQFPENPPSAWRNR
jgi:pyruvate carboxylase subunit A